jgi:DNA-binding transcriptional regulator YbjK
LKGQDPGLRRDPVGRKRAIVQATVTIIAQRGLAGATHRAIAAQAGVPLGATTYYFPTLRDLHAAAFRDVSAESLRALDRWTDRLAASDDPARTLAELTQEHLADADRVSLEYEMYLTAARDLDLRHCARVWCQGLQAIISTFTDAQTAEGISALLDGAVLQALVTGEQIDVAILQMHIARMMQPPPAPSTHS